MATPSNQLKTCPHLQPIEQAILDAGAAIGAGMPSPYSGAGGTWYPVAVTFDEPSLRRRLNLPAFVQFAEYDGRVAGSDASFYCTQCKCALMGLHPNYAQPDTKRIA
ncbi:MAG TPA: hypothetical protein VLI90_17985 [Tepidisphaeraceae bacterium]|nr:hypothetical protein [Tepidisphaeraceae bacterium]